MAITGAIFDCDGTLIDSLPAWRGLEGHMAGLCGIVVTPEERRALVAMTIPETAAWFHERGLGESTEAVIELMDEWMIAHYRKAELIPGAKEFLQACADAGIVMTVASSSPVRYLVPGLEAAGILHHFKDVISVDDLGTTKRQPDVYHHARAVMGTPPESTWGFEDSLYAMETLADAGYPVVGLHDPLKDPLDAVEQAAAVVITDFRDLALSQLQER